MSTPRAYRWLDPDGRIGGQLAQARRLYLHQVPSPRFVVETVLKEVRDHHVNGRHGQQVADVYLPRPDPRHTAKDVDARSVRDCNVGVRTQTECGSVVKTACGSGRVCCGCIDQPGED